MILPLKIQYQSILTHCIPLIYTYIPWSWSHYSSGPQLLPQFLRQIPSGPMAPRRQHRPAVDPPAPRQPHR